MSNRRAVVAAIASAWVVGAAASAIADPPKDQYAFFGTDDAKIIDKQTNLNWLRRVGVVDASTVTPQKLVEFCAAEGADAGDVGDWRPPTVKELLTLVDEQPHPTPSVSVTDGGSAVVYTWPVAFPYTPTDRAYVTLAPEGRTWVVDFATGEAFEVVGAPKGSYYLRCVR